MVRNKNGTYHGVAIGNKAEVGVAYANGAVRKQVTESLWTEYYQLGLHVKHKGK